MKDHRFTVAGLIIGLTLYLVVIVGGLDLFEALHVWIYRLEAYEVDELIIPAFIVLSFSFYERIRNARRKFAERQQRETFLAAMKSTQHVLNNFLNQMELFRIVAEETPDFDPKALELYEKLITDTTEQIKALGEVTEYDADSIWESVKPK